MERYYAIVCQVLWREFAQVASGLPNAYRFRYLDQGLHETPDKLRTEVQAAVDAVSGQYRAVLLGYGLCSNGLSGIKAREIPIVIPRAHDCITFLLGSKERYQEYFDGHPGTYWYSPGWIETGHQPGKERYEKLRAGYVEKYGEDNADYLMDMEQGWFKKYSRAVYVDTGLENNEPYKRYTRDCADWLKWEYDALRGDDTLIKKLLSADWDPADFVVVPPGRTLVADPGKGILAAE